MREDQAPSLRYAKTNPNCEDHEVYEHPAFGTITMTIPHGSHKDTLFGSDIGHNSCVRIEIHRAELKRDLSHDWIYGGDSVLCFEMSHAQFAQFITSQGNGSGTPITMRWIKGEGNIPGIKKIETKNETFRREIAEAARRRLDGMREQVKKLGELLDGGGPVSKKELRELHQKLNMHAEYMPGTMEYVVKCAEEALDKATSDAKIEVETYIHTTAQRIGLKHIDDLARLENKSAPSARHEMKNCLNCNNNVLHGTGCAADMSFIHRSEVLNEGRTCAAWKPKED